MPRGRAALDAMGVSLPPLSFAAFPGIRFIDGASVAEARFHSGPGAGIPRTTLWRALAARAEAVGGTVELGAAVRNWTSGRDGIRVETDRGSLNARLLVGADGLHSRIRKLARLERPASRRRRFGVRQHFDIEPWTPFVEVHWSDGCEAYVTPVGPRSVGVAFLASGHGLRFADLRKRFPLLDERLAGATPRDRERGAGPFDQRTVRRYAARVALVGDAAGYVDPLTGEGLSLGFESARELVRTFTVGESLAAYDRAYRRAARIHVLLTKAMLSISARPTLRRWAIRQLALRPRLFEMFLAIHSNGTAAHIGTPSWPATRNAPAGGGRSAAGKPLHHSSARGPAR